MNEKENRGELRGKLIRAKDIEEVRAILGPETAEEEINQTWREIEAHRPADGMEAVDDDELAAVSGGADRDLDDDGCSATVEKGSRCWSDDYCTWVEVTYSSVDFCTDGYRHDLEFIAETLPSKDPLAALCGGTTVVRIYACKKCNKRIEKAKFVPDPRNVINRKG